MIRYRIEVNEYYTPQVKKGFFGKWYNLYAYQGDKIVQESVRPLSYSTNSNSIKMCFGTAEEAREIINRHKRESHINIKSTYIYVP